MKILWETSDIHEGLIVNNLDDVKSIVTSWNFIDGKGNLYTLINLNTGYIPRWVNAENMAKFLTDNNYKVSSL